MSVRNGSPGSDGAASPTPAKRTYQDDQKSGDAEFQLAHHDQPIQSTEDNSSQYPNGLHDDDYLTVDQQQDHGDINKTLLASSMAPPLKTARELMPPPPRPAARNVPQPEAVNQDHPPAPTSSPPVPDHHTSPSADNVDTQAKENQSAAQTHLDLERALQDEAPEPEQAAQDMLEPFDWDGLEQRYHDIIARKDDELDKIRHEHAELTIFFVLWCDMIGQRESERTFKRHKTQQYYVRQEEDDVEKRRKRYINVVDAFKSAMDMLSQ